MEITGKQLKQLNPKAYEAAVENYRYCRKVGECCRHPKFQTYTAQEEDDGEGGTVTVFSDNPEPGSGDRSMTWDDDNEEWG